MIYYFNSKINKIKNNDIKYIFKFIYAILLLAIFLSYFILPYFKPINVLIKIILSVVWLTSNLFLMDIFKYLVNYEKADDKTKKYLKYLNYSIIGIFSPLLFSNLLLYYFAWANIDIDVILAIIFIISTITLIATCFNILFIIGFSYFEDKLITMIAIFSILFFVYGYSVDRNLSNLYVYLSFLGVFLSFFAKTINRITKSKDAGNIVLIICILLACSYFLPKIASHFSDVNTNEYIAIVSIIASIIGGSLTFLGVAWTIKNQNMIHMNKEKLNLKPYLVLDKKTEYKKKISYYGFKDFNTLFVKECAFSKKEAFSVNINNLIMIKDFVLKNTDAANCLIKGFVINNKDYYLTKKFFLEKNAYCLFSLSIPIDFDNGDKSFGYCFNLDNPISSLKLIIEDVLENNYYADISLSLDRISNRVYMNRNKKNVIIKNQKINIYTVNEIGLPFEDKEKL